VRPIVLISLVFSLAACGGGGGDGKKFPGAGGPHTDHHGIAIADFDDDGFDDIIAARIHVDPDGADPGSIAIFLRDGADPTKFLAPVSYPVEPTPYAVAVGDLNSDGAPDVAVASTYAESGFRVMLQTAGGALAPSTLVAAPAAIHGLALADVDQDGLNDVVAVGDTSLYLFTQKSAEPGTFNSVVTVGSGSRRVTVADLDGDDLLDLATPRNVGAASADTLFYLQDDAVGGGWLPAEAVTATHPVDDVGAADLDGDLRLDLGISGTTGGIGSFEGEWSVFTQKPDDPIEFVRAHDYDLDDSLKTLVALGDLDGDGETDAVLGRRTSANKANRIDVFLHDVADRFVRDERYEIPDDLAKTVPELYDVEIADMNDDTLPDIVLSTNEIFYFPQRAGAPGKFDAAVRVAGQ
jgi:hypothetical protein